MNTKDVGRLMFLCCLMGYGEVLYLSAYRVHLCIFEAVAYLKE